MQYQDHAPTVLLQIGSHQSQELWLTLSLLLVFSSVDQFQPSMFLISNGLDGEPLSSSSPSKALWCWQLVSFVSLSPREVGSTLTIVLWTTQTMDLLTILLGMICLCNLLRSALTSNKSHSLELGSRMSESIILLWENCLWMILPIGFSLPPVSELSKVLQWVSSLSNISWCIRKRWAI